MIWNIDFQLAGLFLLILIFFMGIGKRKLFFVTEKSFANLLVAVTFSTILDISSIFAINYREVYGELHCLIVCKLYLLSIVVVTCLAAYFTITEIKYEFPVWVRYSILVPMIVEGIVLFFLPLYIYAEEDSLYTYGPAVMCTYFLGGLYLVFMAAIVIAFRKKINVRRKNASIFWICMWVTVSIVQFLNNEMLLVSLGMAIACVYIFAKIENPEFHLDPETGVINKKGFLMIVNEALGKGEGFPIVAFTLGKALKEDETISSDAASKFTIETAQFVEAIEGITLFRLDDELFAFTAANRETAETVTGQILNHFSVPFRLGSVTLNILSSMVYLENSAYFKSAGEIDEVLHYFIKECENRGQDQVLEINEENLKKRSHSIEMMNTLEWAMDNNEVVVYFQPLYEIASGHFTSMEALVRIHDRDGKLVMPGEFVETAELNGMILRLGDIMFRKVCEFIERTHIEQYGVEHIEVNLSIVQCMQSTLAEQLKDIMAEYRIPPHFINFEITESAAAASQAALKRNMDTLIAYGSSFALDDYGKGFSNLIYMVELPLEIIKLDKELTDYFLTSEKVRIAMETSVNMIHRLGLKVVVEGVETKEQFTALKEMGVEYIQGYYFSKPRPKEEVIDFIKGWL